MPPGRDATELDWLRFMQRGVLSWHQAVTEVGRAKARRQLTSGRWRSVCHGVLLTHNGPLTERASLWVAVLAVGQGVVVAGLTAAIEAGLRGFRSAAIHLLLVGGRRCPDVVSRMPDEMPAILVHRTSTLSESHIQLDRPLRTTTARAMVDAAHGPLATTRRDPSSPRAASSASSRRRRSSIRRRTCRGRGGARSPSRRRATPRAVRRPCQRSVSYASVTGSVFQCQICRSNARTPRDGCATSTPTGKSIDFRSRSTVRITWMCATGRPTCGARTTYGSPATGFSGSPRGKFATGRRKWRPRSAEHCAPLAGTAKSRSRPSVVAITA